MLDYTGDMELARANNRQGLPVGGAYLRKASGELRLTTLPIVDELVSANSTRARDAMDAHHPWLVLLPTLVAVALLFAATGSKVVVVTVAVFDSVPVAEPETATTIVIVAEAAGAR